MSSAMARRWGPWLLLACVVVVALVVGTRPAGRPPTQAERVQHIASQLRCPVCEGQTVADSAALISRDIRAAIQERVAAGQPDQQIIAFVVHHYPGTLLTPPARGVGMIVWALPVLAFVAAAAGLGLAFARWRSRPALHPTEADRALVNRALER
jgi:cytochrome c-type biogenesis protein CcmH